MNVDWLLLAACCAKPKRRSVPGSSATRHYPSDLSVRKGKSAEILGPVVNWLILAGGREPGLFNALFFGGMGRVSLKCHTPTQTAL